MQYSFLFSVIFLIVFNSHNAYSQSDVQKQECVNVITGRIIERIVAGSNPDVSTLVNSMQANGTWSTIDYQDQHSNSGGWSAGNHFRYLKEMAIAYRNPINALYLNENLRAKLILGFEFITSWNYPKDLDNWWYNNIGDPQNYMIPLILMKNVVGTYSLMRYSAFIKDQTSKTSHRGKNRTWVSDITIHKACIENNYELLGKGYKSMASVLEVVPTIFPITAEQTNEEGIKSDGSFFQHRRQLQSASYGFSIVGDLTTSMLRSKGTLMEACFTTNQRSILSTLLLEGHLLLGYRNVMDFGSKGRSVARNGSASMPEEELDKMIEIDAENSKTYTAWKQHKQGGDFPKPGNKYFWDSYIMTQHGTNYYLSAKVISKRSNGTECINGENTKGYNLPLGATNILTHGKEYEGKYTDDIYPIWDWTRIPGTTAALNQSYANLPYYQFGTNTFGGGASDGNFGAIAYEHDYLNLKAKKAYFFMGDVMFCMGAGITAIHNEPVTTSVNQCFASGTMRYSKGGDDLTATTEVKSNQIKWAWHDNVGYIFPQSQEVGLKLENQTGSWRNISTSGSTATITNLVASLWINHGVATQNGTYQYIVVPAKTLTVFKGYASNTGFVTVQNDANIQALRNDLQNRIAIVFYTGGLVETGMGFSIHSDRAAIVLIEKTVNGYKISASDPNYVTKNTITLTITKELAGSYATKIISPSGKITKIAIPMPTGQFTGSTISNTYTEESSEISEN